MTISKWGNPVTVKTVPSPSRATTTYGPVEVVHLDARCTECDWQFRGYTTHNANDQAKRHNRKEHK